MPRTSSWCAKEGVNKGAWTSKEDEILSNYVKIHGEGRWRTAAKNAGLSRCAKSCRLRWLNYLKPGIKRGNITKDEEDLIIRLHRLLGNRWSLIAGRLPGRTDNEIKNFWNSTVMKKMKKTRSSPSLLLLDSHDLEYEEKEEKNTLRSHTSMNPNETLSDPGNKTPLSPSCALLSTSPIDVDQEISRNNSSGEDFVPSILFEDNMDNDDVKFFLDGSTNDGEGLELGGFASDPELTWLETETEDCMLVSALPSINESLSLGEDVKEQWSKYKNHKEDVTLPLDVELKKLASFLDLDDEWREG